MTVCRLPTPPPSGKGGRDARSEEDGLAGVGLCRGPCVVFLLSLSCSVERTSLSDRLCNQQLLAGRFHPLSWPRAHVFTTREKSSIDHLIMFSNLRKNCAMVSLFPLSYSFLP